MGTDKYQDRWLYIFEINFHIPDPRGIPLLGLQTNNTKQGHSERLFVKDLLRLHPADDCAVTWLQNVAVKAFAEWMNGCMNKWRTKTTTDALVFHTLVSISSFHHEDVPVSTILGTLSALEALCDYALYKSTFTFTFTLHYQSIKVAAYIANVGLYSCRRLWPPPSSDNRLQTDKSHSASWHHWPCFCESTTAAWTLNVGLCVCDWMSGMLRLPSAYIPQICILTGTNPFQSKPAAIYCSLTL